MFSKKHSKPQNRIDSLIGAGTIIEGDLNFSGGMRIDGQVSGNVVATQFHPEKSADSGLRLYRNFVHWAARSRISAARAIGELV